jgi:hypothetical protein
MELAIAVGQHNLSAAPVILAVIVIAVAAYFIWQRRKNQPNGPRR